MAVAARALPHLSVKEQIATLQAAVEAGHEDAIQEHLGELGDETDRVATEEDVRAIVAWRDRLDRIARAVRAMGNDGSAAGYVLGYLADADRRLDRARTRMLGARDAARREDEAVGVRDRVLALLAHPRRPGEISEELRCDASQVSRAVRELAASGQIVRVAAPTGAGGDRRAHWYAQPQMDVAAAS